MTTAEKKTRGAPKGPRGPRQWKDRPTARERVMTQSLAAYIKDETGRDISPESVRAVRFCLPKWWKDDSTQKMRENIERKLEKATLQEKREKALAQLREIESDLTKYDSSTEEDEDDDEDNGEDVDLDYEDDEDEDDTESEDVFDEDDEKVSAKF